MRRYLILITSLILLAAWLPLRGQNAASRVSVITYLDQLAKRYEVRFSYNVKLLRPLQFNRAPGLKSLEAEIEHISRELPLQFNMANEGNYAISPVRRPLKFKVSDAQDGRSIELVYVTVNGEKQFYLLPTAGEYSLGNSFPSDSLQIRTSFYQPLLTSAAAVAESGQVFLSQDTVNLGEITVHSYLTSGVNSFLGDHRLEVDMKDLALIAGETDGDVFQVLQAIPGIRSPNGKPGSLNFRGSPFSQNLTLFDNIPIYHTGHFFGTFSPYNPSVIDRIAVYRGTLPSRYGGRVGGLIEVETSDQVPDSTKTEITLNTVTAGVELETPVGPRLGLHVSARSNFPGWLSPKLEAYKDLNFQGSRLSEFQLTGLPEPIDLTRFDVRFMDLNARLVYDLSDKHKLSGSYLYIDNQLDYELDVPRSRENETHSTELDNTGVNLGWRALWSERFNTEISFTNSSFRLFENRQNVMAQNQNGPERDIVNNTIDDTRFNALFNLDLNSATKLSFGFEYKYQDIEFSRSQRNNIVVAIDENKSGETAIRAIHGSIEQQFGSKLIMNAGLRAIDFDETDQQFLDPRISLTYLATKNFFLKASGGITHQFLRQSFGQDFDDFRIGNQFWVLIDKDDKVVEGTQFMLGALYEKSDWLFDLEVYKNQIDNIFQGGDLDPDSDNRDQFGDLRTIGLDFLVKKRWPGFETWLSYTLGSTQERFERARTYRAAYYDQRNVLNVKWLYPRDRWSVAVSWNMMSGLPVREPDQDEIMENPMGPDDLPNDFSGRFPIQHQMDLSATYQFSRPGAPWRGVIGFSILNLYDRNNVINIFQENVFVQDFQRFGVGFAPNIQLKLTF